MMEKAVNSYEVSLSIPFPSKRLAEIAYDVLRVDIEPKRSFVKKTLSTDDNILIANFIGEQAKHVRVGLTSFYEALILCCETMNEFGPPATERYDYY